MAENNRGAERISKAQEMSADQAVLTTFKIKQGELNLVLVDNIENDISIYKNTINVLNLYKENQLLDKKEGDDNFFKTYKWKKIKKKLTKNDLGNMHNKISNQTVNDGSTLLAMSRDEMIKETIKMLK